MKGYHKPFSKELHALYDNPAKMAVAQLMLRRGHTVKVGPKHGVDLIITMAGTNIEIWHEVEVKNGWPKTGWPREWPTVHVTERKGKYRKAERPTYIWVLRSDLQQAWVTSADNLRREYLEKQRTKYSKRGDERFFKVPVLLWNRRHLGG